VLDAEQLLRSLIVARATEAIRRSEENLRDYEIDCEILNFRLESDMESALAPQYKSNNFQFEIRKMKTDCLATLTVGPRARTLVRQRQAGLVSDEVREEVRQHAEQRETTNAISCENPGSAAFMMFEGWVRGRGLLNGWNHGGPIFHAHYLRTERSWRKLHYASRLPRVVAGQGYLRGILPPFFQLAT
jgi:hypothetical protein